MMMKITKKIISFIMICLLFSGVISAYAEETVNPEVLKSLKILQELGLVAADYDAEVLDFNTGVTRAELASLTEGVFNSTGYIGNELYYHDVSKDFWAYSQIGYLVSTGALTVPENKLFYPDRVATEAEAYKIMISLLGLDGNISMKGTWPNNVYSVATNMKITQNVVNDGRLTYDEIFMILHNALLVELPEIISFSGDGNVEVVKGNETYLEKYYNIYAAVGVVEVVGKTASYNKDGRDGKIVISGAEFNINGLLCDDYLGTYVEYYYKHDYVKDENSLLRIESAGRSKIIKLTHKDNAISYNPQTRTITYKENDSKDKNIRISQSINIVYNGRFLKSGYNEVLSAHIDNLSAIATDGGNNYNLLIIEAYDNRVISTLDYKNNYIYTTGGEPKISLNEFSEYIILDAEGKQIELSDLNSEEIISIYETKCKDLITIVCSDKQIYGTINGYETDSLGYTILTLDDTKYYTEYAYSGETVEIKDATLILDHKGFVVDIKYGGTGQVAVLLEYMNKNEAFDNGILFRIYTSKGEFLILPGADKIEIDGKLLSSYDDIDVALGSNEYEQLITYGLNKNGEIKKIDTIRLNADGDNGIERVTPDADKKNNPSKSASVSRRSFNSKLMTSDINSSEYPLMFDGNTIVFGLPGALGSVKNQDESYFTTMKASSLGWDWSFNCEGYWVSESRGIVDVVIVYNKNWGSQRDGNVYMVVSDQYKAVNSDGDVVTVVQGYGRDGSVKCEFVPDVIPNVKNGDFVHFLASTNKGYETYEIIYRPTDPMPKFIRQQFSSDTVVAGYVCSTTKGFIFVSKEPNKGSSTDYDEAFNLSSYQLHIYDTSTGEVIPNVSYDEIRAFDTSGVSDIIVVRSGTVTPTAAIIYR